MISVHRVTEHVYAVQIEDVKVFLIVQPDSLTLIDAGFPGTVRFVEQAVRALGRTPEDIRDVLVTHCHPDHAGGLAEIASRTGARVWMHPDDAEMVRAGRAFRPYEVTPGEANADMFNEIIKNSPDTIEPVAVVEEVLPGEEVPAAGGVRALGAPGHTRGHLVFLWPGDEGVLFLGDAAKNEKGLVLSPIYEDRAEGVRSLCLLGAEEFETVCFAHGDAIVGGAPQRLRQEWSE